MEYHELANKFRLMDGDEFRSLVEDVRKNGMIEPILTFEDKILDGRNRYKACMELGIEPTFQEFTGDDAEAFVWSMNYPRRHLTPSQRAVFAAQDLPSLEAAAKERQRNHAGTAPGRSAGTLPVTVSEVNGEARQQAAKKHNVSASMISAAKRIARDAPEVLELVAAGDVEIPDARKLATMPVEMRTDAINMIKSGGCSDARQAMSAARLHVIRAHEYELPADPENCRLLACDIAHLADQIEPDSVDAIITDPPYEDEALGVHEDLAKLAAKVLKPGGSLVVMIGKVRLPEILLLMTPHIMYLNAIAYLILNSNIKFRKQNLFVQHKLILWFVKGGKYAGKSICDVVKSDAADKRYHEWGQSESGISELVKQFSEPGDLVLDPLLGGGTTAVCSLRLGRRFIGSDIDDQSILITRSRLAEAVTQLDAASV